MPRLTRSALDSADIELLKKEAKELGLPVVDDRAALIDSILNRVERIGREQGQTGRGQETGQDKAGAKEKGQVGSAMGRRKETGQGEKERGESRFEDALQQVLIAVTNTMQAQQIELQRQQQEFFSAMMQHMMNRPPGETVRVRTPAESSMERAGVSPRLSPARENGGSTMGSSPAGGMIRWIAAQIPEFGGSEEECVVSWARWVDRVAIVHDATDGITLLAASSRLVNTAKQWYDYQDGRVIES